MSSRSSSSWIAEGTGSWSWKGLDDVTLDVEITANRGDLLSHAGVARELESAIADPGVPEGSAGIYRSPATRQGLRVLFL